MLERWTIDMIGKAIPTEIRGAAATPKTLRRFYRLGKRHGKKAVDPKAMREFLQNAVDVASSSLAQEYLEQRSTTRRRRDGASARQTGAQDVLSSMATPAVSNSSVGAVSGGDPNSGAVHLGGSGDEAGGPDLTASLDRVRAQIASQERQQRAAQDQAAADHARETLASISIEAAEAAGDFKDLFVLYRQRIESCHQTGELMWSRYCVGFMESDRRASGADSRLQPNLEISFRFPAVLVAPDRNEEPPGSGTPEQPNGPTGGGSGDEPEVASAGVEVNDVNDVDVNEEVA